MAGIESFIHLKQSREAAARRPATISNAALRPTSRPIRPSRRRRPRRPSVTVWLPARNASCGSLRVSRHAGRAPNTSPVSSVRQTGEQEDAGIHADFVESRNVERCRGNEELYDPACKQNPEHAAGDGQQQAFRQHHAELAAAAGSESRTNRRLAAARRRFARAADWRD